MQTKDPLTHIITSAPFKKEVEAAVEFFTPLMRVQRLGDMDKATACFVVPAVERMEARFAEGIAKKTVAYATVARDAIVQDMDDYKHPFFIVAGMYNPRVIWGQATALPPLTDAETSAFDIIVPKILHLRVKQNGLDATLLSAKTEMQSIRTKTGLFAGPEKASSALQMPPNMFWEWCGGGGISKELGMKLCAQPSGCGSTERHWKGFKDILSKKRNRLGHQKAGKLMEVKCDINRELQELNGMERPARYVSDRELIALDLGVPPGVVVPAPQENVPASVQFRNWKEAWESDAMKDKGDKRLCFYVFVVVFMSLLLCWVFVLLGLNIFLFTSTQHRPISPAPQIQRHSVPRRGRGRG